MNDVISINLQTRIVMFSGNFLFGTKCTMPFLLKKHGTMPFFLGKSDVFKGSNDYKKHTRQLTLEATRHIVVLEKEQKGPEQKNKVQRSPCRSLCSTTALHAICRRQHCRDATGEEDDEATTCQKLQKAQPQQSCLEEPQYPSGNHVGLEDEERPSAGELPRAIAATPTPPPAKAGAEYADDHLLP
jgi:hypothetical protein